MMMAITCLSTAREANTLLSKEEADEIWAKIMARTEELEDDE